jgi:hypothetical protein
MGHGGLVLPCTLQQYDIRSFHTFSLAAATTSDIVSRPQPQCAPPTPRACYRISRSPLNTCCQTLAPPMHPIQQLSQPSPHSYFWLHTSLANRTPGSSLHRADCRRSAPRIIRCRAFKSDAWPLIAASTAIFCSICYAISLFRPDCTNRRPVWRFRARLAGRTLAAQLIQPRDRASESRFREASKKLPLFNTNYPGTYFSG